MQGKIQIRATSLVALACVLTLIGAVAVITRERPDTEAVAIIGAVGSLVLALLPAVARFSGRS